MRKLALSSLVLAAGLSGCGSDDNGQTNPEVLLTSELKTSHSYEDIADAAVWQSASDASLDLLLVSLEGDGLALFDSQGQQVLHAELGEVTSADLRYQITASNGDSIDLVALALPDEQSIAFYSIAHQAKAEPELLSLGELALDFAAEGLCLYKNTTTSELSVIGVSDLGIAKQYKLDFDGANINSTIVDGTGLPQAVRELNVGGKLSACAVDDETANLYIAEQNVGIWAYGADAENVKERKLVDSVAPLGHLEEIEGIGLSYQDDGQGYLVVADEGAGLLFYQRDDLSFSAQTTVVGFDETKTLAVARDGLWLGNSELEQPVYEKLAYASLNTLPELASAPITSSLSHRELSNSNIKLVKSNGETEAVDDDGDAADDPAFWLNQDEPSASLIIATNKQGGLMAYNLDGQLLQYLQEGEPNNVDLRQNIVNWDGSSFTLAAASNRELNTISLYQIQAASNGQEPIVKLPALGEQLDQDQLVSSVDEVYGLCMYLAADDTPYVFVNGKNGVIEQWRLSPSEQGIHGQMVRQLQVESQPEGCVVDDQTATLYVGEEDVGIWSFNAEETASGEATAFASVDGQQLVADIEGLTLYDDGSNKYLLASSQGNNSYVLYDLNQQNQVVGSFAIIADDQQGFDGASDTDGIVATAAYLGEAYPEGLFIAQDWYNVDPNYALQNQNFKLVSFEQIRQAFELP
ncbi:phytase [Agarivorans gilvus]|uniref:3-phytase n=1 Tax=Agarivorans gilvus TaxID=680279 RepID=A0ABQ1HZL6_9ALTE|nr:phytase [Agarivorans gilvus]GGB02287.1 3-phytase [Agarivorans gilvus]